MSESSDLRRAAFRDVNRRIRTIAARLDQSAQADSGYQFMCECCGSAVGLSLADYDAADGVVLLSGHPRPYDGAAIPDISLGQLAAQPQPLE